MRKINIVISMINNLVALLEENERIYFDERPYIENPELYMPKGDLEPKITPQDERRRENEIKIKNRIEEIDRELAEDFREETREPIQERLLEVAEPIEVVIKKPMYNDFVTVRDIYLMQAKREMRKLKISSPGVGECIVTPEQWIEKGKRIEKEFLIKGKPMILWGNYINRFN